MSANVMKSDNLQYFTIFNEFEKNEATLKQMFEHPDVRDRTIVSLSIYGIKRKGKSFFMNNCLKFLYSHFPSVNIVNNPLQNFNKNAEDDAFGFPSGHNNQATNDVLIWNDLFLYTNDTSGEKLAIVLMDVQKSSENTPDQANFSNIFEFLSAISSIQIVNLYSEIDCYQLEFIKTFLNSNEARNEVKSLQSLVLLVRDWTNLDEYTYGIEGGNEYLAKLSESNRDTSSKLTINLLKASCEKFNCILLPHPGSVFVNKGNYEEIYEEFKDGMRDAIKYLFKPENLVSKKLINDYIKGANFVEYIQQQRQRYRDAMVTIQKNCDKSVETSEAQHQVTTQISSSPVELSPQDALGPLQVLKFSDDNKILTEYSGLKRLLEHAELNDRKIVALSTVGVYRKGKSFFLNYCLRYLYAHYSSLNHQNMSADNSDSWMGDKDELLNGFSWRSGSVRDTSGILVWNDAFLSTNSNNEKIAIIVIDTQGLFESGTHPEDDSRIFTLGTLMSSILILNLFDVVQENQLEYIQYAIESAKFAVDKKPEIEEKPFQHLVFLIRDWGNQDDHLCGLDGGNEYLKYFLKSKSDKREEFKSICEVISESFEQINCSLLPHPGNTVAVGKTKNKKYNGNWIDMDEDFKDELKVVIEFILNPTNLMPRKVNGVTLNGPNYLAYIQKCFTHFQSDQNPQVKTICDSTMDKDLNKLIISCFNSYKDVIRSKLKDIKNLSELQNLHEIAKNVGMDLYKKSNKLGDSEHEKKYQKELEDKMSTYMKEISVNEERNFKAIEEEAQKLRLIYEQKEKDQVSKYGSITKPVERQPTHADPSTSGRLVDIKSRPMENDPLGIHKYPAKSQQHHVEHHQTHNTRLDPITDKELNTLVESCITQYKKMMLSNQNVITNEDNFTIYHGMNKSGAILKFEDSKSVGNPKYANQYKNILENEIEEIFKNFKFQLQQSLHEEIERNRALEAEEARRVRNEQIRQDEKYARELAKQEKLKLERELNVENKNNEEKIQALEVRLKMAENARIEAERGRYLAEEFASRKKKESGFFKKIFLMVFGGDHRY